MRLMTTLVESLESRQFFSFGAPLANFGVTGQVTAPTIGGSDSGFGHAQVQADGKIVAAVGGGLTRTTAAGAIDTTFGQNGIVPFRGFSFRDFAIDASGRIDVLATGTSGTFVLRYTATGALDTGFASGGTALVESSRTFHATTIALQADGKLLVAGSRSDDSTSNTGNTARVYRLTAAGGVDTAFGTGGVTAIALGTGNLVANSLGDAVVDLRQLSNGKIELLGSSYNFQPGGDDDNGNFVDAVNGSTYLALARLNASGTADTGFGSGGVARRTVFDDELLTSGAGAIRADGSAVVTVNDNTQAAFVGFSAGGAVAYRTYDASFARVSQATDAAVLGDARVALISDTGRVFTIDSATGVVSNVVTPQPGLTGSTSDAIAATANGDLVTTVIKNGGLVVTATDAGNPGDPRPDNFAGALATDTFEDQAGNLHVASFDAATKTLKYTYRNAAGLWGRVVTVDATAGAGANLSIGATSAGGRTRVAIAYYDASTADLKVATTSNLRKFAIQTVASRGAVGLSPSLLFTDTGGYAVSYYSKTSQSLYYSVYNGKAWTYELVDSGGSGAWNELQFDGISRRPAIAYSGPKNTVKYALKDKKTGWGSTIATTTASGAAFVNLALPYDVTYYGPVISYYDLSTADLVLLHYNRDLAAGQRWTKTTVSSRGAVGAYNELFSDYAGDAVLYAWNRNSDAVLRFDVPRFTTDTPTATVVATGGGRYLSATGAFSGVEAPYDADTLTYLDTSTGTLFVR